MKLTAADRIYETTKGPEVKTIFNKILTAYCSNLADSIYGIPGKLGSLYVNTAANPNADYKLCVNSSPETWKNLFGIVGGAVKLGSGVTQGAGGSITSVNTRNAPPVVVNDVYTPLGTNVVKGYNDAAYTGAQVNLAKGTLANLSTITTTQGEGYLAYASDVETFVTNVGAGWQSFSVGLESTTAAVVAGSALSTNAGMNTVWTEYAMPAAIGSSGYLLVSQGPGKQLYFADSPKIAVLHLEVDYTLAAIELDWSLASIFNIYMSGGVLNVTHKNIDSAQGRDIILRFHNTSALTVMTIVDVVKAGSKVVWGSRPVITVGPLSCGYYTITPYEYTGSLRNVIKHSSGNVKYHCERGETGAYGVDAGAKIAGSNTYYARTISCASSGYRLVVSNEASSLVHYHYHSITPDSSNYNERNWKKLTFSTPSGGTGFGKFVSMDATGTYWVASGDTKLYIWKIGVDQNFPANPSFTITVPVNITAVHVSKDLEYILIGQETANAGIGEIRVYRKSGESWTSYTVLANPQAQPNTSFGKVLWVSSDGRYLAAGAPTYGTNIGSAWAYTRVGDNSWISEEILLSDFKLSWGCAVCVGDTGFVGVGSDSGLYIYPIAEVSIDYCFRHIETSVGALSVSPNGYFFALVGVSGSQGLLFKISYLTGKTFIANRHKSSRVIDIYGQATRSCSAADSGAIIYRNTAGADNSISVSSSNQ